MNSNIVAVIGAGTMGNGIAQVFASYAYQVILIDIDSKNLELAKHKINESLERLAKKQLINSENIPKIIGNIHFTSHLSEIPKEVTLIVEAVSEQLDVKQKIFNSLEGIGNNETILASNTSSISITKLANSTQKPDRVIGMHFMNPVPIKSLVELIAGIHTSNETIAASKKMVENIGKNPILVKDYPGFVANRILMPMINEAIETLNNGVAQVEDIDQIMISGMAHPMGPLELADYIGLDVCLAIIRILHQELGSYKYAPSPLLVKMVEANMLGIKTNVGFYNYNSEKKHKIPNSLLRK
jgi:3-hydroxybutyryl-CoA dehydrogenase